MSIVNDSEQKNEQEQMLQEIVERSSETVFTLDDGGAFTYANPAARKLTGYTPDELIGRKLIDLAVPDWRERVEAFHAGSEPRDERNARMEYPIITRHGVIKWIEETSSWLSKEGQISGLQGTLRDVTERVRAEEARQRLKQLQADFVATVSHELKTPLTSILGYVQLLQRADDIPEHHRKHLAVMERNTHRLRELVDDILQVEKLDSDKIDLKIERIDLSDLIEEVAETFRVSAAEKGLEMDISITPGLYVEADRTQLILAFSNLVSNAIKYTPTGTISIKSHSLDGQAITEICDTGIGISQDDMGHLFERFFRSSSDEVKRISGSGLGLYIAREVLKRQGGEISVRSNLGEGSTFKVSLRLQSGRYTAS